MQKALLLFPFVGIATLLASCLFSFGDNGEWKKNYGTPELLLENARSEAYVYLYEDQNQFKDKGDVIKDALKEASPYTEAQAKSIPQDVAYFTYEAKWTPATSGPNYEHLSIWKDGYVRIHHKTSLGPHEYLYFSLPEAKAASLVEWVFSIAPVSE